MALSYEEYAGDGATTDYNVTVPALLPAHIGVLVDGTPVTFIWLTASQVRLDSAPAGGTTVRIQRTTPSDPLVDYEDGATLFEAELDTAYLQALYIAEEARDAVAEVSADDIAAVDAAKAAAEAARDLAQKWASEAEDVIVDSGEYSAKHYSLKAAASAALAATWNPASYRTATDQDVIDAALQADIDANAANISTNTSDIALKANKASPALTGTATAVNLQVSGELQADGVVQTPRTTLTSSTSISLSMTGPSKKELTLDHNATITVSGGVADQSVIVWIKQGATGGTATWAGVTAWRGGSAPTLSTTTGEWDKVLLETDSSGNVHAEHLGVWS